MAQPVDMHVADVEREIITDVANRGLLLYIAIHVYYPGSLKKGARQRINKVFYAFEKVMKRDC